MSFYGVKIGSARWHARLGHPSSNTTTALIKRFNLPAFCRSPSNNACHICLLGKASRLPFTERNFTAPHPLHLLHLDVWGPSPVVSTSGFRYYLSIVDDCTRFTWMYPMVKKSDVLSIFRIFQTQVENLLSSKIKIIQCDEGGEFTKYLFRLHLQNHGITQRFSCPHTPQQNGVVERKHRDINEMGLCLMAQSNVPSNLWVEAFSTAVFLINRLPTSTLNSQSPYEKLFGRTPDYNALRVFGCTCFPHLVPYNNHKLLPKSTPCVFLGYDNAHKGYRCLDPHSGKLYISRHVTFDEDSFPYQTNLNTAPPARRYSSDFHPLLITPPPHLTATPLLLRQSPVSSPLHQNRAQAADSRTRTPASPSSAPAAPSSAAAATISAAATPRAAAPIPSSSAAPSTSPPNCSTPADLRATNADDSQTPDHRGINPSAAADHITTPEASHLHSSAPSPAAPSPAPRLQSLTNAPASPIPSISRSLHSAASDRTTSFSSHTARTSPTPAPASNSSTSSMTSFTPPRNPRYKSINALVYGSSPHPLPEALTAHLHSALDTEPSSYTQASKFPHWQ